MSSIEVYRRSDQKWAWRLKAGNNEIIATDGGQGFENEEDALDVAVEIVSGSHSKAATNFKIIE